jgi:hypothetical protein
MDGERRKSIALQRDVLASFFQKNPLTPETALVWAALSGGRLTAVTAIDARDSVAIAKSLATRKGPLSLPSLKRISPKTLTALIEKQDVEIPLVETLELIPEPDGSLTEDFVIPATTGSLVPADPEAMAQAIAAICANPAWRQQLSAGAHAWVAANASEAVASRRFRHHLAAVYPELPLPPEAVDA